MARNLIAVPDNALDTSLSFHESEVLISHTGNIWPKTRNYSGFRHRVSEPIFGGRERDYPETGFWERRPWDLGDGLQESVYSYL